MRLGFPQGRAASGFYPPENEARPSDSDRRPALFRAESGPGGNGESRPRPTLRPGRGGAGDARLG